MKCNELREKHLRVRSSHCCTGDKEKKFPGSVQGPTVPANSAVKKLVRDATNSKQSLYEWFSGHQCSSLFYLNLRYFLFCLDDDLQCVRALTLLFLFYPREGNFSAFVSSS